MKEKEILDGWKEIARYVGKSIRTVQRWEKKSDFPVYRVDEEKSVFAYKEEVDKWLAERTEKKDKKREKEEKEETRGKEKSDGKGIVFVIAILVSICLLYLGIHFYNIHKLRERKLSFKVESNGNMLIVKDQAENIVKIFESKNGTFLKYLSPVFKNSFIHFKDLNGDDIEDMVFVDMNYSANKNFSIHIFESDKKGNLKEVKTIPLSITYKIGDKTYNQFFCADSKVEDIDNDGNYEIIVTQNSIPFYPNCTRIFKLDGKEVFRYMHPGRNAMIVIRDMNNNGKKEIILGGTNNYLAEFSLPVLQVLESNWKFEKKIYADLIQPEKSDFNPETDKSLKIKYLCFTFLKKFLKNYNGLHIVRDTGFKEALLTSAFIQRFITLTVGNQAFKSPIDSVMVKFDKNLNPIEIALHPETIDSLNIKDEQNFLGENFKILYFDGQSWRTENTFITKKIKKFEKII